MELPAVPDATVHHNPDTTELRRRMDACGLTMAEAARRAGVSLRTIERYLSPAAKARGDWIPYPLQFTLEALCLRDYRKKDPPP